MNVRVRQPWRCSAVGLILTGALILIPRGAWAQSTHDCNDPFSAGIIQNCGFEHPTPFNSWLVTNPPAPLLAWTLMPAGPPPLDPRFFNITPTEGLVVAGNSFDSQMGMFRVAQDLNLIGVGISTVEFDVRASWELIYGATQPRVFEVNIEPAGGGPPLQSTVIFMAQPGTTVLDTGPITGEVDVKLFGGGPFRISFDEIIPENNTGPATFQLDNVQIHPPVTLAGGELLACTGQALNQLIGLDETSAASWLRHQLGAYDMVTDIDFRSDGMLFAATGNGDARILAIDPQTGQETEVGSFGSGIVLALEFIDGVLYGTYETLPTSSSSDLVTIDQSTGALATVGSIGFPLVEGLAYDRLNGLLYGVTSGASGGDLVTVDMTTGAGTLIGATGFTHLAALELNQRGLYAGVDMGAGGDAGKLITIDTSTGAGTAVGQTRWAGMNGLSFYPILFGDGFESGGTGAWNRVVP